MNNFDIIGIGDTVMDTFIRLSTGRIEESARGPELCLPYGTKMPFDSSTIVAAVGNSANAIVSASRLGLKVAILTYLGKDDNGKSCLETLQKEKVSTDFVQQEDGKNTNHHYVLWFKEDRTILIKHTEFTRTLPDLGNPKWLYLSSLGADTANLHKELISYIEAHPEVRVAFQPGTFQLGFGKELMDLYKKSAAVCVNKEEAQLILETDEADIKKLLDMLSVWCPNIVIITDGHNGSYMKVGAEYSNMPIYPDIAPPFERTGAGDAFFSTFVSYLAKGVDPKEAIRRAPINSMSVVQHIGAQEGLLTDEEIEEYLQKAPENYRLTAF
jgi:sugar/nucleoside kinase (ribokinase family)